MSYLNDKIITYLKNNRIESTIPLDSEHDLIANKINENIPFSVSNIAWNLLKDSKYIETTSSQASLESLTETIRPIARGKVIILGDSTDNAYSISINDLSSALQLFSTIAQHTYIIQETLK